MAYVTSLIYFYTAFPVLAALSLRGFSPESFLRTYRGYMDSPAPGMIHLILINLW